jgi:hypothetical protein
MRNLNEVIERNKITCEDYSLDQLLDEINVSEVDEENTKLNKTKGIIGWYYVSDTVGICAYFGSEAEALRYRLDLINLILNS